MLCYLSPPGLSTLFPLLRILILSAPPLHFLIWLICCHQSTLIWRGFCGQLRLDCYGCSVAKFCPTLCNPMNCSTPGFPVHHCLPLVEFMSSESLMPSNHLILLLPLLHLPSVFGSLEDSSLPMSWLFASDGQNIGASALASVLPVNIQD